MVNHCPNTPLVSDTKMEAGFSRPSLHAEGIRPTLSCRRESVGMHMLCLMPSRLRYLRVVPMEAGDLKIYRPLLQ